MTASLELLLQKIDKHINDYITNSQFEQANEALKKIQDFNSTIEKKIKGEIHSYGKGFFLSKDEKLEEIKIGTYIRGLLSNVNSKFAHNIINEIAICKPIGKRLEPVYYYSIDLSHIKLVESQSIEKFKLHIIDDLDYLVRNVIQDEGLQDGEGVIANSQIGSSFDILIRIGNYFVAFNNTNDSIDNMKNKYGFEMKDILVEICDISSVLKNPIKI